MSKNMGIMYNSFFKGDDGFSLLKKELSIKDQPLEVKQKICMKFLGITNKDIIKLEHTDIDKYLKFIFPKKRDYYLSESLIFIANDFIEKIINIKDFNLSEDKNIMFQKKLISDNELLDKIIKYKEGTLSKNLITEEIRRLSDITSIERNENGEIAMKSDSLFLTVEIQKISKKIKNIEERINTEMNQIVVELAAIFEGLCKNLIEFDLVHYKDICTISAGKIFDYNLLKESRTTDEIKKYLLEEAVTNATMGSVDEWLMKTVTPIFSSKKKSLSSVFKNSSLDSLRELYQRRNLIVHNNSEINEKYKNSNPEYKEQSEKRVVSKIDYLRKKIHVVLDCGISMIMGFLVQKKLLSSSISYSGVEKLGLILLEEEFYESASIVFKKLYEETGKYLDINTPRCFLGYFNYCLASLISKKQLPTNEQDKIEKIIERLERDSDWFKQEPQMNLIAKTVLLQKGNLEFIEVLKEFLEEISREIEPENMREFTVNFFCLPVFKLIENEPKFIDLKHSLRYD